ncbi:MAG: response regulator [Deltaproteobacteria bacterium]|nr:response regulator [Deltaproteobacteria bacterium]
MPKTVLIVDGAGSLSDKVKPFLREMGYGVRICDSADACVLFAKELKPDLILSESDLRTSTGIELARRVKSMKDIQKIPFVLATYLKPRHAKDSGRAVAREPDDYIIYPITQAGLYAVLAKWLENDSHARTETHEPAPDAAATRDAGPDAAAPREKNRPRKGRAAARSIPTKSPKCLGTWRAVPVNFACGWCRDGARCASICATAWCST